MKPGLGLGSIRTFKYNKPFSLGLGFYTMEVNGARTRLVTDILLNSKTVKPNCLTLGEL